MISFDRWLKRPMASFKTDEKELDALEDRLEAEDIPNIRLFYGQLQCRCCVCDEWVESPVGIDELEPLLGYEHYCGGSPRCCP